eukprot:934303-Rhodomonas_salina.1
MAGGAGQRVRGRRWRGCWRPRCCPAPSPSHTLPRSSIHTLSFAHTRALSLTLSLTLTLAHTHTLALALSQRESESMGGAQTACEESTACEKER